MKNGIITIHSPRGGHRTFRIRTQPADAKFAPNRQIVAMLTGPDNGTDYTSFGFVVSGDVIVWQSRMGPAVGANGLHERSDWEVFALMLSHRTDFEAHGYRYLHEATCRRCNRRLTTPESIAAGVGPECGGRV